MTVSISVLLRPLHYLCMDCV